MHHTSPRLRLNNPSRSGRLISLLVSSPLPRLSHSKCCFFSGLATRSPFTSSSCHGILCLRCCFDDFIQFGDFRPWFAARIVCRSVRFSPGADLREYGVRRGPMFRALLDRALILACDTRIQLEASEHNAVSCFILDSLNRCQSSHSYSASQLNTADGADNVSPWAVTYMSHVRSLAGFWSKKQIDDKRGSWAAFFVNHPYKLAPIPNVMFRWPKLFSRQNNGNLS